MVRTVILLVAGIATASCGSIPPDELPDADGAQSGTPTSAPTERAWEDVIEQSNSAVVRILVTHCEGDGGSGSGFVVGDDLVMTAAHVVDTASSAAVKMPSGAELITELIAFDDDSDSALLRTYASPGVTPLSLSPIQARQGSELRVLGYPLGMTQINVTNGTVGAVHERVDYQTTVVSNVFTTDAATNLGNSGGPVLEKSGQVIGLVSGGMHRDSSGQPVQGLNYIVSSTSLVENLAVWQKQEAQGFTECDPEPSATPSIPSASLEVTVEASHEDAHDLARTLFTHGEAINKGDYSSAWDRMTPAQRERQRDFDRWANGLSTTYWETLLVRDVTRSGSEARAQVNLVTTQSAVDGFEGQACSVHEIEYEFALTDGEWLIELARRPDDPSPC